MSSGKIVWIGVAAFFGIGIIGQIIEKCWYVLIILVPIIVLIILYIKKCNDNNQLKYLEEALDYIIMSGLDFEKSMAHMLRIDGYTNIKITPGSGDYGVDILANNGFGKYVFQCKYYSSNLGLKPIQEVFTGKVHYKADVAVVVTNVYFSKNAQKLAKETGVILWDRDYLIRLIRSHKYKIDNIMPIKTNRAKANANRKIIHTASSNSPNTNLKKSLNIEKGIQCVDPSDSKEDEKNTIDYKAEVFISCNVEHKIFGTGEVVKLEDRKIIVKFEDIERTFIFPQVFEEGFLELQ